MSELAITPTVTDLQTNPLASGAGRKPGKADDPARVHDAAQQFEALLMGQMLRSVREGEGNWLSTGDDSSGDSATEFAEQQFASTMAQQGGLGLATLITEGLSKR